MKRRSIWTEDETQAVSTLEMIPLARDDEDWDDDEKDEGWDDDEDEDDDDWDDEDEDDEEWDEEEEEEAADWEEWEEDEEADDYTGKRPPRPRWG
jgi:hypothetical protein